MQSTCQNSESQAPAITVPEKEYASLTVEDILIRDFGATLVQHLPLGNASYLETSYCARLVLHEGLIQVISDLPRSRPARIPIRQTTDITRFSPNSRMRLFRWLATVRTRQLSKPLFVTFTYHDDQPTDPDKLAGHLGSLLNTIRTRRPNWKYAWRKELQQRGSVHYHFIVWSTDAREQLNSFKTLNFFQSVWFSIKDCHCKSCFAHAVHIEPLTTKSKVYSYMSKYVAKEEDGFADEFEGRRWGTSRDIPRQPLRDIHISVNEYVALKKLCKDFLRNHGFNDLDFWRRYDKNDSFTVFIDLADSIPLLRKAFAASVPPPPT